MKPRTRIAISVGSTGAWLACIVVGGCFRSSGHPEAGSIFGAVSILWLALALWGDAAR